MFDFEKLQVYQKAKVLNNSIVSYLNTQKELDPFLKDQLYRASISVVINIAEGAGRFSYPDKRKFYIISRGSAFECMSLLEIIKDQDFLTEEKYDKLSTKIEEIVKMLCGLIKE